MNIKNIRHNFFKNNLKIIQYNCRKKQNIMYSILEYAKKNSIDIVLLQEPGIFDHSSTISHSNFVCIISKLNKKSRIVTYINKCNKNLKYVPRIDLLNDENIQIINVSINEIENIKIINIYNQKTQKSTENRGTFERFQHFNFANEKIMMCGDFNAHHQWGNSSINRSIRIESIIDWVKLNRCDLINIFDEITRHENKSQSVIDLTFASKSILPSIINGTTNNESSESNHEIISFEIITFKENISFNSIFFSQ